MSNNIEEEIATLHEALLVAHRKRSAALAAYLELPRHVSGHTFLPVAESFLDNFTKLGKHFDEFTDRMMLFVRGEFPASDLTQLRDELLATVARMQTMADELEASVRASMKGDS